VFDGKRPVVSDHVGVEMEEEVLEEK